MSLSRPLVALTAALFSSALSLDPWTSAPSRPVRPARPAIVASQDAAPPGTATTLPAMQVLDAPLPPDLSVELRNDPRGRGRNVVVSRRGHLVALGHGAIRTAGKDWASMRIDVRGTATKPSDGREIDRLIWETTPLGSFTTERGVVSLSFRGAEVEARLLLSPLPEPVGRFEGKHHGCAAHRDVSGGYVLLCRFPPSATKVSALNLTGVHALDGAWVIPGKEPFVRLDLPLSPGLAEARLIGFVHGITGASIRVEAAWAPGEEPTLLVDERERVQPTPAGL